MIRIQLTPGQIAWVDENVGKKRYENAVAQRRVPGNAGPPPNLEIDILGARCEAAAYTWARPVKWHWNHFGREHKPDLHDFIDVKGVGDPSYNLMVKPRDPEPWAFLLVDGSSSPSYDIVGWCWGFEALDLPAQERKPGRPTHFVDRGDPLLKDPELLLLVLRERQEFPGRRPAYEVA